MIIILTQNKGIVNLNHIKSIFVDKNKEANTNNYVVVADDIILGYYNTLEDAVKVVIWIADSIGNKDSENATLIMPQSILEKNNDN